MKYHISKLVDSESLWLETYALQEIVKTDLFQVVLENTLS